MFRWFRNRRRSRILESPFPAEWERIIERNVWHDVCLTEEERIRLRELLRIFIAEKNWEGCAGVTVTEEMQVTIAALACLLLLGIEHDFYPQVLSILIYPDIYLVPEKRVAPDGVVHEGDEPRYGEAWYRGPVVLAWDEVLAGGRRQSPGRNLVLHEFAHQLDMLDGPVNGTPPLENESQFRRWEQVVGAEFRNLVRNVERGRGTLIDPYGATNEAEFFAVITECFFERAPALRHRHPELYEVLRDYYRQDPASWRMPSRSPVVEDEETV